MHPAELLGGSGELQALFLGPRAGPGEFQSSWKKRETKRKSQLALAESMGIQTKLQALPSVWTAISPAPHFEAPRPWCFL